MFSDEECGQKTVSVLLDGQEAELEIIDHPASEMSVSLLIIPLQLFHQNGIETNTKTIDTNVATTVKLRTPHRLDVRPRLSHPIHHHEWKSFQFLIAHK